MPITDKLTSIAAAIREKGGTTEKLTLDAMPTAIAALSTGGGGDCNGLHIPEEYLTITGSCQYRFYDDNWNWFIELFGDKIKTNDITNATSMFQNANLLTRIPFSINTKNEMVDWKYTFINMNSLSYIERIPLLKSSNIQSLFSGCCRLRELPVIDVMEVKQDATTGIKEAIRDCYSLREIPDYYMKNFTYNTGITSASSHPYYNMLYNCNNLDEAKKIRVNTIKEFSSNIFQSTFSKCYRLKGITFDTLTDGTPLTVKWKKQTIDLSQYVGWAGEAYAEQKILNYNSGITAEDEDNDWSNNPNYWTRQFMNSRFNHTSAVELINSLPDASAYLATQTGTGNNNTVKFYTNAGSATPGGGVNALTEEEIAVATAKGWTIGYTA